MSALCKLVFVQKSSFSSLSKAYSNKKTTTSKNRQEDTVKYSISRKYYLQHGLNLRLMDRKNRSSDFGDSKFFVQIIRRERHVDFSSCRLLFVKKCPESI